MTSDQFFTRAGRPTVRVLRHYPHPIDKVWRAVTTPEHLGAWFPSPTDKTHDLSVVAVKPINARLCGAANAAIRLNVARVNARRG